LSTISPEEAWRRIASRLAPLAAERLPRRAAAGRVLAEPLAATVDVPAADVSAMDGYALAGTVTPGERRPVAATIAAGDPPGLALPAGQAARIMTGAPVPLGADRIVPIEATRPLAEGGDAPGKASLAAGGAASLPGGTGSRPGAHPAPGAAVLLLAPAAAGDHIRRRAEVQRAGEPLLPAGARLTPGAMAVLATHGYGEVPVHRAPAVAVLATGDEVVPPEQVPGPGQLRDSHTDFLLAAGAALGLRFTSLGIAPDRAGELAERLAGGLAAADVMLVCGGVSMGEFDLVEGVLERLGCQRHFDAVAIQPGKPLVFATHPRGVVFGLPGNPASVMVDFCGGRGRAARAAPTPGGGPRSPPPSPRRCPAPPRRATASCRPRSTGARRPTAGRWRCRCRPRARTTSPPTPAPTPWCGCAPAPPRRPPAPAARSCRCRRSDRVAGAPRLPALPGSDSVVRAQSGRVSVTPGHNQGMMAVLILVMKP
jgi:molybdopterin molybdotransferase